VAVTTPPEPHGWSSRRRRTLLWLGGATVVCGIGALLLPAQYGVTSAAVAGLCLLAFVAAVVVFSVVPGPGTAGTLVRSLPLAGSVLVVSALLVLSTAGQPLRPLWIGVALLAAGWTASAAWRTWRSGRSS
jgi:NhaP-type Na+/H+ or K+/H+ antiporter